MSRNSDRSNDLKLQQRISRLVEETFDETPRTELAEALRDVADALLEADEAESSPEPDSEPMDAPALGAGLLSAVTRPVEAWTPASGKSRSAIEVEADNREVVSRVLRQIHNVGGLLLELPAPPALNDQVHIEVEVTDGTPASFEATGRVVYRSRMGTAIELTDMDDDSVDTLRGLSLRYSESPSNVSPVPSIASLDDPDTAVDDAGGPTSSESSLGSSSIGIGPETDPLDKTPANLKDPDVIGLALSDRVDQRDEAEWYWYGPRAPWIDIEHVEPRESRQLQTIDGLLLGLSREHFSGLLGFEVDTRRIQLQFDEGFITEIATKPDRSRDELGPMLRMAERVTQDELARAASHAFEGDVSLERSLYDLEILEASEIRQAVAGRLSYLMHEACDLGRGYIEIYPPEVLPEDPRRISELRVHVATENVIYRRRLERFRQKSIGERLDLVESYGDQFPRVTDEAGGRIERAFTDQRHGDMVDRLLDGRRRLKEVVTGSFLAPGETVAVVFALRSIGMVEFREDARPGFLRQQFEDDIAVKHLSVHKASYFEVLNVHWSSYDPIIERAYRDSKARFDPDSAPPGLDEEMHGKLEDIDDRLDSAYKVLKKRESRHGYRQKIMPDYKLQHAIPIFRKRAELAVRRGQLDQAEDSLLRILEVQPGDHEAQTMLESIHRADEGAEPVERPAPTGG